MSLLPLIQSHGALFVLWLHLCGCGGYYDDSRGFYYHESTAHMSLPDEAESLNLKKSAPTLAKRSPLADAPTDERRALSSHVGSLKDEVALTDNRIRTSGGGQPTGGRTQDPPTTRPARRTVKTGKIDIFPRGLEPCAGEGAIFRMRGANGRLKNCAVITPQKVSIQLYPPSNGQQSDNARVTYFDYGAEGERCGFRIDGVQSADIGTWYLSAVTDEVNVKLNLGLGVTECPANGSQANYAILPGMNSASRCGPPKVKACNVEGPGRPAAHSTPTAMQMKACSTPSVPFSNLVAGEWTCEWASEDSMLQRTSRANIGYAAQPIDQDVSLEWRNSSSPSSGGRKPSLVLHCDYLGSGVGRLCRFVRPAGDSLYPSEGLAFGRYSYLGRGVALGDCSLSVELPLVEEDIGVWRCEVVQTTMRGPWDLRGGFLEVGIANRTREEKTRTLGAWNQPHRSTADGEVVLEVVSGGSVAVGCSALAPLTLCLIREPGGNASAPPRAAAPDDATLHPYGRGGRLGDCGLLVRGAHGNHSGSWECVVGIDYGDAVVVPIRVLVHEEPLVAEVEGDVSQGLPVNFTCRSVLGVSLDHCRFERPDRSIVMVIDSRHPDVHRASWRHGVRAVGDLGAGVCSVSIPSLRADDLGEWTCVAKAQDSPLDYQLRFRVTEEGISVASVGSISAIIMTVIVVAAVGGAVGYRLYIKRRLNRMNFADDGTATRDDSVISFRRDGGDEDSASQAS